MSLLKTNEIKADNVKNKTAKVVKKEDILDKTSVKYKARQKVVLKYVNKILECNGDEAIQKITDFKNVERKDIIKHSVVLDEMEDEILEWFSKRGSCFDKNTSVSAVLNCLRRMVKINGLEYDEEEKVRI